MYWYKVAGVVERDTSSPALFIKHLQPAQDQSAVCLKSPVIIMKVFGCWFCNLTVTEWMTSHATTGTADDSDGNNT